jgi:hypothetical protein
MTVRACSLTFALASSLALSGIPGCTEERSDPQLQVTSCGGAQNDPTCLLPSTVVGNTSGGALTLRSVGDQRLVVSQVGAGSALPATLSLDAGDCQDRSLSWGESCTVGIRFAPDSAGVSSGSFTFATNAPSARVVTVTVSATGLANDAVRGVVTLPAEAVGRCVAVALDVDADRGNGIAQAGGQPIVQWAQVASTAHAFELPGIPSGLYYLFAVVDLDGSASDPASGCSFGLPGGPSDLLGYRDGTLLLPPSAPPVVIPLSLASPPDFDFAATAPLPRPNLEVTACWGSVGEHQCALPPMQPVGTTATGLLTLRNAGPTEPLLVFDVGATDGLASPFGLSSDTCTGNPLSVYETCTLGVDFNSSVAGTFQDTFSFATDAANGPAVTIQVLGDAAAP